MVTSGVVCTITKEHVSNAGIAYLCFFLQATNPEDPGDGTEPPGGGLPDGPDDPEVPINPDAPGTEGSDPEDPSFPTLGYVGIALAVIAVIVGALAYLVIRNRRKKTADAIAGADSGGTGAGKKDVLVDGLQHVRFLCLRSALDRALHPGWIVGNID